MRKTRNHHAKGDKGINLLYNNIIWKSLEFILQFSCFCLWTNSMHFEKKVFSFQFYVEPLVIKSTICFSLFCKIVSYRIYLRISLMYCMNYGKIARFVYQLSTGRKFKSVDQTRLIFPFWEKVKIFGLLARLGWSKLFFTFKLCI